MLRTAFAAIAERHLEATQPPLLGLWALRGLGALDPALSATQRGPALTLRLADRAAADRLPGATPASAAEAVAALYDEAERQSPALRRAGRQAMLQAGFEEVFNHLDPYSRYLTPEDARQGRERRLGVSDLGLVLDAGPRRAAAIPSVAIRSVAPGSAAARAGLRPGDRLLEADGIALSSGDPADSLAALEGPAGSSVLLLVRRAGRRMQVVMTRGAAPPALSVTAEQRDGILWLRVPVFSAATPAQLDHALARAAPPLGVVLDLRGNRGGLLQQAIQVTDSFLSAGVVATTEGRHPDSVRRFAAAGPDLAAEHRLVVLVDGRTASAAEVVAAAIGDLGRGVVVGSTTQGKGLIQVLVPLPGGAEMALSWSRILAPRGWPLQMLGVLPALCTSRGAEEAARALPILGTADDPMGIPLARARAARAPVPASEVAALRGACPPAEGREADLAAARAVLERPDLYAAALAR